MMNTFNRNLFVLALVFYVLGFTLARVPLPISSYLPFPKSDSLASRYPELALARYYSVSGQFDLAIDHYLKVGSWASAQDKNEAVGELNRLLFVLEQPNSKLVEYIIRIKWFLPSIFMALAVIAGGLWALDTLYFQFKKRPRIAFSSIKDYSDLRLEDDLAYLISTRLSEIRWNLEQLDTVNHVILHDLDIPTLGMISDHTITQSATILETALSFSTGISNLPLSGLVRSLRLWLEQPQFIVRATIRGGKENVFVHIFVTSYATGALEKIWNIPVNITTDDPFRQVTDAVIFPLVHQFGGDQHANNWECIRSLYYGLEAFIRFRETKQVEGFYQAQKYLEAATNIDSTYEPAQYNLALISLIGGDYELARKMFSRLSNTLQNQQYKFLSTYNYAVALAHIVVDWALKRSLETYRLLQNGEQLENSSVQDIKNLIISNEANLHVKLARRDSHTRDQNLQDALDFARQVVSTPDASRVSRANAYIAMGLAYVELNDYEQGLQAFNQSIEYCPDSVEAYLGLAELQLRRGNRVEALRHFRYAYSISPLNSYAIYRAGKIYQENGDIELAIEAFNKAPNLAMARLALGKLYLGQEKYPEALNEFRAAVQINSRQSVGWSNIAWAILEMSHSSAELVDEAIQAARRAVTLDKGLANEWHSRTILARALHAKGDYSKAAGEAFEATKLKPDHPQPWLYWGQALFCEKKIVQAKEKLSRVKSLDPKGEWWESAAKLIDEIDGM